MNKTLWIRWRARVGAGCVAAALVVAVPSAGAALLSNAGFETEGDAGQAAGWWHYPECGRAAWAAMSGAAGYSFYPAGHVQGGFGQDVGMVVDPGDQIRFTVYAKAEANYTNRDTTIGLEFYSGGALAYAVTGSVYDALDANRGSWTLLELGCTNTTPGITRVTVRCDYGHGTIPSGATAATCQWDDSALFQMRAAGGSGLGRFEPLEGVYLGVLTETGGTADEINQLNQKTGKRFGIYAKFLDFKDGFPGDWVNMIRTNCPGAGVHIILEPVSCFSDFFATNWGPGQATYDAARAFATNCAASGVPIFLRFAHEPNGWWYSWAPSYLGTDLVSNNTYIIGWRNFARLVHSNAPNVAMVWAPNEGNGGGNQTDYDLTYPGDEFVDWVGMSLYNGEWYGNSNAVMDYEFRNALQRGYWQDDGNPDDDTIQDFYWTYSDPNNPTGHHKPMMIAETSSQWRPAYSVSSSICVAAFESLSGSPSALTTTGWSERAESPVGWWGAWCAMFMSNTADCVDGTNAFRLGATSLFSGYPCGDTYVGGNGRDMAWTNWSRFNGMILQVKRAAGATPDPMLSIGIRCASPDSTAFVQRVITSTSYVPLAIGFSGMSVPANFNWTNVDAIRLELFTTNAGVAPADVFVDDWRIGALTNTPDQAWWTPWGLERFELSADCAAGHSAVRIGGTDSNNDYFIGGTGCSLEPAGSRNWTNSNALALQVRRELGPTNVKPDPKFKITCDNDYTDDNGNEVYVATRVANSNYTGILIPFADFAGGSGFTWTNVVRMKIEFYTSGGITNTPYDCYLDDLCRVVATVTNSADNVQWKGDWLDQLYSQSDDAVAHPYRVDLFRSFRNLHMINWFEVRKFEDGETRDFTLLEFPAATPVCSSYYAHVANAYFLTNVVVDSDGDGMPDEWEQRYFGGATNGSPSADADGDGVNNWQEYVAATSPTNGLSRFEVSSLPAANSVPSGQFVLRWSSESRCVYTVERAGSLQASFARRQENLFATPPENVYTDAVGTAGAYFYRIQVVP